jgi:hypothetical protein
MSKPEDMDQLKRDLETIAAAARTPFDPAEEYPEGRPEDDPFECDELLRRRRNRGENK